MRYMADGAAVRFVHCWLELQVRQFERHHKRLVLLSDSVEREINMVLKTSSGDLTRLLPIQKSAALRPPTTYHML